MIRTGCMPADRSPGPCPPRELIVYGAMGDDGYGRSKPIKSSRMGKEVGYEALQRYYVRSKETLREPGALDELRSKVRDTVLTSWSKDSFCRYLREKGVDAVFRTNPAGRIYGVTFVDHDSGIAANGSTLGKLYSANVFNTLYGQVQNPAMQPSQLSAPRSWQEAYLASHPGRSILELFDMQAYEERQQELHDKKKKRRRRRFE